MGSEVVVVKRTLIAIPAVVLLVAVIYFHGLVAMAAGALIAVLCIHEMLGMVSAGGARPIRPIVYAFGALLVPACAYTGLAGLSALFIAAVMAAGIVLVLAGRAAADGAVTVLPVVYPGMFLAALAMIVCVPDKAPSQFLLIIVFGAAALTDTFAYLCGMLLGRHKLAPAISPKKTVEGAVGGMVFGTASVLLAGMFLQSAFGMDVPVIWYAVLGLVLSAAAQFGDLIASMIKRRFGMKDYGRIMGPHGGAMDRLDSVLFISPVVLAFYYLLVI